MTKHEVLRAAVVALVFQTTMAGAAQAQPLAPARPAGPQSLPGDVLPGFGMLDNRGRLKPDLPAPPSDQAQAPDDALVTDADGPSLALALEGALAAVRACKQIGSFGAATVINARGEARAMVSSDGTDGSHVFVAQRKALTSVEFGMPSDEAKTMVKKDPMLLDRVRPNMFVQLGAFPLRAHGKVIGAIGYSGGEDIACGQAGWKVMQSHLPD